MSAVLKIKTLNALYNYGTHLTRNINRCLEIQILRTKSRAWWAHLRVIKKPRQPSRPCNIRDFRDEMWNHLTCSNHSEFLQRCFLIEPTLTLIMAQEKPLPNDNTSLHATEIKGDVSNRNAVSTWRQVTCDRVSGAPEVREGTPSRGLEGPTQALGFSRRRRQMCKKQQLFTNA